jgi:mRNA deadenylase 3'-5' endonuclease subunit Ccr4
MELGYGTQFSGLLSILAGLEPLEFVKTFQWNVLADGLSVLDPPTFGGFSKESLSDPEIKHRQIIDEMKNSGSHVFLLQECDMYDEILGALKEHGYDGHFFPKTGGPCKNITGKPDGLAVFWSTKVFHPINYEAGNYAADTEKPDGQGFQLLRLVCRTLDGNYRTIVFANTHLKSKSENEDVRVRQIRECIAKVHAFADERDESFSVAI